MFVILSDGRARLDFIQNMEYKFVELLSAMFVRSSDEVVRQQITYRYNAMKVRFVCLCVCVGPCACWSSLSRCRCACYSSHAWPSCKHA